MAAPVYATFADFTMVGSIPGLSQTDAENFLAIGSRRVDAALGSKYTVPFSSNVAAVNELTVLYARMMFFTRTRKKDDAEELRGLIKDWVSDIMDGNAPLVLTDGTTLEVNGAHRPWSSTMNYTPTFNILDEEQQTRDPDRTTDEINEAYP